MPRGLVSYVSDRNEITPQLMMSHDSRAQQFLRSSFQTCSHLGFERILGILQPESSDYNTLLDGAGATLGCSSTCTETWGKTGDLSCPAHSARRVCHAHLGRLDPLVSRSERAEVDAGQKPPGADDTSSSATTPEAQKNGLANRKVMATTHSLDGNGTPSRRGTERGHRGNSTLERSTERI